MDATSQPEGPGMELGLADRADCFFVASGIPKVESEVAPGHRTES